LVGTGTIHLVILTRQADGLLFRSGTMVTRSLSDLDTPAQRQRFIDHFAARLAEDAALSSVFGEARSTSHCFITQKREQAWWASMLAGTFYQGRPLRNSHSLPHIGTLFSRWCHVLKKTINEYFHGPQAAAAQGHMLNVATMLAHCDFIQRYGYSAEHTIYDGASRTLIAA
jgi:truncated hemoglobin YjbI